MAAGKPSLLRQIVDEVDAMSDEQKAAWLRKIKIQQAVEKLKAFEEKLPQSTMSEEEIWEMCSQTRTEMYQEEQIKKENELSY